MTKKSERRVDALSKQGIIDAAIGILDSDGEAALTFRALAARLMTGAGAIYWHISDKDELLVAAVAHVVGRALRNVAESNDARGAIRALLLGVFDAIEAHPWVGTQLAREPWQPAMGHVFEGIGSRLAASGVPASRQFEAASALVNYILGAAAHRAAAARALPRGTDRTAFLGSVVARWVGDDIGAYPFVHSVAGQLRDHDDRAQFLGGIDLILAGLDWQIVT
ncbi:TetR/AcrR family transcriptional regulator [Asticcacaulis benevestitus]|uniref:HTH tetR-type domain-containing protein n=1 Tax=Asticcacaulis benevestitus DSM 16100 = ATCC BAA-896 TaxID=1121022 RepID=V4PKR6_9CAUL|nr:TetR/AcrR family transcriptional regulator [Asticcacaulis benevestitus]ESQ87849.1 hypothetical protein ABENE_16545 [Asticcacaulis benevestitus DSM 16100 = ATCC BAA-896]